MSCELTGGDTRPCVTGEPTGGGTDGPGSGPGSSGAALADTAAASSLLSVEALDRRLSKTLMRVQVSLSAQHDSG
jgi:hypothetical protein